MYGIVFLLVIAALRTCYLFAFCEYKSVLVLPEEKLNQIKLTDSLYINPYLSVEGVSRFIATINFENVTDSFTFKSLEVKITSFDIPDQHINLTHVLAYKHPSIPGYTDYVRGDSFNDLPEEYKTISVRREPWAAIMFRFETDDFEKSKYYNFKITGTVNYKGKIIGFRKEIKAKRKKKFLPIQMMT